MFDRIEPADLRMVLRQERTARLDSTPVSRYQYVTVTWDAAGATDIAHDLAPTDPLDVRWLVVSSTAPLMVSQPVADALRSTATTVWLTSDAAGTARLLLFLEA